MSCMVTGINLFAVLAAAVVGWLIGGLWYSPVLFGNIWIKEMKKSPKELETMKKESGKAMGLVFLVVLLECAVLAKIFGLAGVVTLSAALKWSALLWLGFVATTLASGVLFAGKSVKMYVIDAGHYLVIFLAAGAILAVWR